MWGPERSWDLLIVTQPAEAEPDSERTLRKENLGVHLICSEGSRNLCLNLPRTIFILKDHFKEVKP